MKLVRFIDTAGPAGVDAKPGLIKGDAVVDISSVTAGLPAATPQMLMESIIDKFSEMKPELEKLLESGTAVPIASVKIRPPLPRPSKILCCIGNYWEHMQREAGPLNMFLKSPDAVIGDGDTVVLPNNTSPYMFQHEAELAIVFKGPAKDVSQADHKSAIFGYTCMIDVSARAEGRRTWRQGSWMGKSFDTFAPIGPCIVTADEIADPYNFWVKFWIIGDLRHVYVTDDM